MIYQRRAFHHARDREIALMPIDKREAPLVSQLPVDYDDPGCNDGAFRLRDLLPNDIANWITVAVTGCAAIGLVLIALAVFVPEHRG